MKTTASFIRGKTTQNARKMFGHFQVRIKHIIWQTSFAWMSFQTWIRAMEFSYEYFGSDATLLTLTWQFSSWIGASDLCMWLAFQQLSPICCFSLYWLGWIFRKPCPGAICRLTLKNLCFPAQKTPTTTAPNPLWCCSNEDDGFFH